MRMPVGNIMTPLLGQTGGSGDRVVAGPNADCRNMPLLRYMCTGGMHADCICILPCRYITSDTCNKYMCYMCNIKIHFFIMWLRPYFVYMYPYADPTADEADPTADDGTAPIRFDPIRSDQIRPSRARRQHCVAKVIAPMLHCRRHRCDISVPCRSDRR